MSESSPELEQPEAVIEEWEIQFLRSHPLQKFYFSDEAGADVDELAADILANGLQQLIEITPDGTVISGHRRRLAMMQLVMQGREELRVQEVVVRYDLAAEGADAIKRRFLEENRNRRHLTPMAFAAVSRGLYELEIGTRQSDEELKQQIALQYRVSTKTLDRWWALLDLPIELQCLIERKELPQQLGQQLLDYVEPKEIQELVELARSGSPEEVKRRAREIVKERLPVKPRKEKSPEDILMQWLELSFDMTIHYEEIEEILRQNLGELKQILYYYRRARQAELAVQRVLDIVKKNDRLDSDDLEYRPTLGRSSIEDFVEARGADSSGAADSIAQPSAKRTLPPLKLKPAKKLPPLKLQKRPPAA